MADKQFHRARLRRLPSSVEQSSTDYPLAGAETIGLGRDPRCQIMLESTQYRSVSRRHAEICPVAGGVVEGTQPPWQVCDLNSANGTFVNGQRLRGCQILQTGDRIMLGQDGPIFVFEIQTEVPPVVQKPPVVRSPSTVQKPSAQLPPAQSAGLAKAPSPARSFNLVPPIQRSVKSSRPDQVSLTQLFPILSTGRELTRKAFLLPGILTVSCVVLLFLAVGEPPVFNLLLAVYLSGAAYYFVYQLCGKSKPWWVLAGAAGMTMAVLASPVLNLFLVGFRDWLPGRLPKDIHSLSFPMLLLRMFFGAGLMEELLKALPVLAAWLLGNGLPPPWRDRIGIREPLDGNLVGAASAVGFTLMETLGQYIPEAYHTMLRSGEEAAQLASLQLLIPRILGSVAGHLAYSGYLGYFVGLSVLRPQRRWLVLSVGYLTAAVLHTLWNATGVISPILLAIVGVLSYAFLTAAILKARELSPQRSQNFATRFYK